jgi:hypothetical protein
LARHTDGVLIPQASEKDIWVIEFQAQGDPLIYHRLLLEVASVGERYPARVVRGFESPGLGVSQVGRQPFAAGTSQSVVRV